MGMGDTLAFGGGCGEGEPNSDDWTETLDLYLVYSLYGGEMVRTELTQEKKYKECAEINHL